MYAIVATCGKQYRVEPGATVTVDHLDAEVGAEIILGDVLFIGGDSVQVGTPIVAGAKVTAKVLAHELGDKVMTLKYKRRKRTLVRRGFRHSHTTLEITGIQA